MRPLISLLVAAGILGFSFGSVAGAMPLSVQAMAEKAASGSAPTVTAPSRSQPAIQVSTSPHRPRGGRV